MSRKVGFLGMAMLFWSVALFAQGTDTFWTRTYGGVSWDYGYSVQQTSDEGYILVGSTESFGCFCPDLYLIKTDAQGDTIWTRTYGGAGYDRFQSVQQIDNEKYIATGSTESFGAGGMDVYLIKIGPGTGVEDRESSRKYFLVSQSEPNPFNHRTILKYVLPQSSDMHIVIYNLIGQEVRILVNKTKDAGIHSVIWDGKDDSGKELTNGVYFCRIQAGNCSETRKMILLR